MVAFVAGQSKGALFEDRIAAVPERDRKADELMPIADSRKAVLVPAIGSGARVIMGQIFPGRAVGAVIFTHGSPRSLAEIRTPALPVLLALPVFLQALSFSAGCFFNHGLHRP